jgi:hypothetical protein
MQGPTGALLAGLLRNDFVRQFLLGGCRNDLLFRQIGPSSLAREEPFGRHAFSSLAVGRKVNNLGVRSSCKILVLVCQILYLVCQKTEGDMEMVTHALNWFEIPVANFERAKKFYSSIFDFEMPENQMGPNRMGFLLYDFKARGIGGAIVQGPGYVPTEDGTLVYLNGGTDLGVALGRVEKAGGKIILPKTLIAPDLGYFAIIRDPEGNRVALHSMQ